jgi:arylsulfatase A-like enzyme
MARRRVPRAFGTCALAAVLGWSCRERPRLPVVYDLAARAAVAEVDSEWTFERPATPEGERLLERGFRRLSGPGADQAAAVTSRATFLLPMAAPATPRRLVLDVEPETAGEEMEVALDGATLGRVALRAGRQRLGFDVPPERQRTPRQRLRIRFPRVEEERSGHRAGPAVARLYDLVVGRADDPSVIAVERQGAPLAADGQGVLRQAAPSRVRFALLRPESAELTVLPALPADAAASAAATVRVLVRDAAGEREVWAKRLRAGERPEEARVSLPGTPGEPFELTLAAEAPADRAAPYVLWGAPRVHGAAPVDPLQDEPAPTVRAPSGSPGVKGVLLVIFDAARARQFGCYGYGRNTTPEVDRLAAEGVVFERHISPAVYTTAAMAAVWSSQYPDAGQSEWLHDGQMPRERLTLAELLSAHGIETAGFIANPSAGPTVGLDRGFALFERLYREPWQTDGPPNADVFRAAVFPWIGKPHGRFLLYTHWREPHSPYGPVLSGPDEPLPADAKRYPWWDAVNSGRRELSGQEKDHLVRLYDGNLAWADRELGLLRRELEKAGLWDQLAVIVTGDHGEALLEHGYTGHNIQLFDEVTRVPMVMRLPAAAGLAGRRVEALTSHLDIAPTVADLLGVRGQGGSDRAFRGRSLLDVARGGPGARGVVSRTVHARPTYALVTPRYKLIHDLPTGDEQLYDLARDPAEREDVAAAHPLLRAALRQSLHRWLLDLRTIRTGQAEPARPDRTETEVLRALGYVQ